MNISDIVPYIVVAIIVLQLYVSYRIWRRRSQFRHIFKENTSWGIERDDYGNVVSITGNGNEIFISIKASINQYLSHNTGSVIDYQLLKDTVDRHCDSVEEDISIQTPVPLYCGLAGTMLGVILGLFPLVWSGALLYLLSDGNKNAGMDQLAAHGIDQLLSGVAWAMMASFTGIVLTTFSSWRFKKSKREAEEGKNKFLSWMQSQLLPALPTNTSDAMTKLVKNLNRFNSVFSSNTSELQQTLQQVNEVYRTQDDIIQAVREMDVMKMARANVAMLQELQKCMPALSTFGQYVASVNEYTAIIKTFIEKFETESQRLGLLEEMCGEIKELRAYFERHKGEIAKEQLDSDEALQAALQSVKATSQTSLEAIGEALKVQKEEITKNAVDADDMLQQALNAIQKSFQGHIDAMSKSLLKQVDDLQQGMKEQQELFMQTLKNQQMQFAEQLQQLPALQKGLNELSQIPSVFEQMASRMEQSNKALSDGILDSMRELAKAIERQEPVLVESHTRASSEKFIIPKWMKYSFIGGVVFLFLTVVLLGLLLASLIVI